MAHLFFEALPVALSMGMSADEFWNGDPWLFSANVEAQRLRNERGDWERWQAGAYAYDALLKASAVINPFSGKSMTEPWAERPYGHEADDVPVDPAIQSINEQADHQRMIEWVLAHGPR